MTWTPIDDFNEARRAGFSPTRAARWAAYVQWKLARGERPISLLQAGAQVLAARRRRA